MEFQRWRIAVAADRRLDQEIPHGRGGEGVVDALRGETLGLQGQKGCDGRSDLRLVLRLVVADGPHAGEPLLLLSNLAA